MIGDHKPFLFGFPLVVVLGLAVCGGASASPTVEECTDGGQLHHTDHANYAHREDNYDGCYTVSLADGWSVPATVIASNSPGLGRVSALSFLSNALDVLGSDKGFMPLLRLVTTFSGEAGDVTSAQLSDFDTDDTDFGKGHQIGHLGPFSGPPFNATAIDDARGSKPYWLTSDDIDDARDVDATAGTLGAIDPTPEPRSMLLMGTGLLLVAGMIRRLRRTQKTA